MAYLPHRPFEFLEQRIVAAEARAENSYKLIVVPYHPIPPEILAEAHEHIVPGTQIGADGPRIVQLVAERNEERIRIHGFVAGDEALFPHPPRLFPTLRIR